VGSAELLSLERPARVSCYRAARQPQLLSKHPDAPVLRVAFKRPWRDWLLAIGDGNADRSRKAARWPVSRSSSLLRLSLDGGIQDSLPVVGLVASLSHEVHLFPKTVTTLGIRTSSAAPLDLQIAYRKAGNGPAVVLLHGGMEDSRSWHRQLEGLAGDFTVLAWDAPGCGQSSDVPEHWRMPDFADALAAWLQALGIERPHVLGLSWGSSIALELYRRHPGIPASLILASAYAGWAGSLPPEEVAARHAGVLAAADVAPEELSKGWPGLFSAAASPELIEEVMNIAADNTARVHPGGYRAAAHAMAEADLRDVLPRIRVPTLLLYGELDERSPLRVAEDLRARIATAELVVIPGVGHLANVEAPDAFNAHVRRFVRRVAGD
jgi:pimeloyl-ACP methyl ester carboxylesterase